MNIQYDDALKLFRITGPEMEYAFAVSDDPLAPGRLVNLHWGAPLGCAADYLPLLESRERMHIDVHNVKFSEFRSGDPFDHATPCLRVEFPDGSETLRLGYRCHKIEENALTVTLADSYYPIEVELRYQTWGDLPLIGKSARIRNLGDRRIFLNSAKSGCVHLPEGRDFRLTHYAGDWGAEYQKNQTLLSQAKVQLETNYTTDAAMHQIPFFALDENGQSTETRGQVYFGALSWSGDFQITLEKEFRCQCGKVVTVTAGINDQTARYPLEPGETFETPLFTCGFSNRGFEHMSEVLYDWELDYLLPRGKNRRRAHGVVPIIYNTWYPYEFDIDEQKLTDFIPRASYIGAELYVIDDGWMPRRSNEKAGLGDWVMDKERFPHGLRHISDAAHAAGMQFGIWVEPEMVNPDSDLFRAHPDWILAEPNRTPYLQRNQYILDMSRDEIRDWAIQWLDELVVEGNLDYLKWDMNRETNALCRNATDRGTAIKYMKNVYAIWQHLNERFPDLLLEDCASGGGRADFGMLPYADRMNRSDNADPIDVMLLHEGYSTLFVPKMAGGAGNVSPEHYYLNGRRIPLEYRVHCGMTGSMSVGVNLLHCDQDMLDRLKAAVAEFKQLRPSLQDAYVYRIASATEHPYSVLQYTRRDKGEFTVFAFGHGMRYWDRQLPLFKMRGLEPEATYVCGDTRLTGRALMELGLRIRLSGDYSSVVSTWKRV